VFGFGVSALFLIQRCEIAEACCHCRVVWPERPLKRRQAALIQQLGIGISALVLVQQRQIVKLTRLHHTVRPAFIVESCAIEYRRCVIDNGTHFAVDALRVRAGPERRAVIERQQRGCARQEHRDEPSRAEALHDGALGSGSADQIIRHLEPRDLRAALGITTPG
jgi:hypothetical protein